MPPSLPTGTVSSTSAGTRTFPPESDRERAPAASADPSRHPQVQPLPTTPRPDLEPTTASRRDHDQVTELKQENEALREYIETQAAERQAVIERYERLLEHREAEVEAETTATTRSTHTSTAGGDSRLGVRTALSSLRSRIARRLGLD